MSFAAESIGEPMWVCCHLGAREHYAVPRALSRLGRLRLFLTDAWVGSGSGLRLAPGTLARRARERFHPDLADADARAFTLETFARESIWRTQRLRNWDLVTTRNRWFQTRAVSALRQLGEGPGGETVVFAHSYSARGIFKFAKSRGWTTVLGQIDPGLEHFRVVRQLAKEWPEYGQAPEGPPSCYFEHWREECALADWIVVNSNWAAEALERAGISRAKLQVVPLPFEEEARVAYERSHPAAFSAQRPLRVLFVGQVSVAKGAAALLEAVGLLADAPVELTVVGSVSMNVPSRWLTHASIRWLGALPRSEVMARYREADVLVFPSYSDGFGMAQIEAQAWRLPIIASSFCGQVVLDGINGVVLSEVSSSSIAAALRILLRQPELLRRFSANSLSSTSSLEALGTSLTLLVRPGRSAVQ